MIFRGHFKNSFTQTYQLFFLVFSEMGKKIVYIISMTFYI